MWCGGWNWALSVYTTGVGLNRTNSQGTGIPVRATVTGTLKLIGFSIRTFTTPLQVALKQGIVAVLEQKVSQSDVLFTGFKTLAVRRTIAVGVDYKLRIRNTGNSSDFSGVLYAAANNGQLTAVFKAAAAAGGAHLPQTFAGTAADEEGIYRVKDAVPPPLSPPPETEDDKILGIPLAQFIVGGGIVMVVSCAVLGLAIRFIRKCLAEAQSKAGDLESDEELEEQKESPWQALLCEELMKSIQSEADKYLELGLREASQQLSDEVTSLEYIGGDIEALGDGSLRGDEVLPSVRDLKCLCDKLRSLQLTDLCFQAGVLLHYLE